jgi:hypothetical protein
MVVRTITIALMFMVSGCVSSTPLMKHERFYEKTISLDGISREQAFDRSREWLTHNVTDTATTPLADRATWTISCTGRMARPLSLANLNGTGNLTYLARETVYEEALIISFELQSVVVPNSYNSATYFSQGGTFPVVQADLGGARKTFDQLSDSLRRYLLNNPANDLK